MEPGFDLRSLAPDSVLLTTCSSDKKPQITRADMAAMLPIVLRDPGSFSLVPLLCVISIPSDISTAKFWNSRMLNVEKTIQIIPEFWIFIWEICMSSVNGFWLDPSLWVSLLSYNPILVKRELLPRMVAWAAAPSEKEMIFPSCTAVGLVLERGLAVPVG